MRFLRLAVLAVSMALAWTAGASAQDTVRITNIGHGYYAGPLYVAMRENLFAKHGLKAEVTFVQGGALTFQSVFTREADFGVLSYEHILTAAAQGRNLVSIFNVTHRPLNNIVVSNALYEANHGKEPEGSHPGAQGQAHRHAFGRRLGREDADGAGPAVRPAAAR